MDLSHEAAPIVDTVRSGAPVDPRGAGTHAAVGHPCPDAVPVAAPAGIVRHDPDDLTVTVLAGTTVAELDAALAATGQQVPLDPVDRRATVGGTLATGLSGPRRLGLGPLRDHVLEIRLVDGRGDLVRAGGPTVKNVTGYDLVRLLIGSLGTLGVFVSATLRCRPIPAARHWWATSTPPGAALTTAFRATAVLADGERTYVGFEGEPADAAAIVGTLADVVEVDPVAPPAAPCRGRISVAPGRLAALTAELDDLPGSDLAWLAEWGVGTVHVASASPVGLAAAREVAHRHDGWLLREAGAPDLDPFGVTRPHDALQARVRAAFDPHGRFALGRFGAPS